MELHWNGPAVIWPEQKKLKPAYGRAGVHFANAGFLVLQTWHGAFKLVVMAASELGGGTCPRPLI